MDWKELSTARLALNNYCQRRTDPPRYVDEGKDGPEHAPTYTVSVWSKLFQHNLLLLFNVSDQETVGPTKYGQGKGRSKSEAKEIAARQALNELGQ